jgi:hypothetical protein
MLSLKVHKLNNFSQETLQLLALPHCIPAGAAQTTIHSRLAHDA